MSYVLSEFDNYIFFCLRLTLLPLSFLLPTRFSDLNGSNKIKMVSTKNVLKFIALRNARRGGGCLGCALRSVTRGGGCLLKASRNVRS